MTTAIAIPDKAWLAMRNETASLREQLKKTIPLGRFKVLGLEHLDSPATTLGGLKPGSKLSLRCTYDSVMVLNGKTELGVLPVREGKIFARLMTGGKRLTATIAEITLGTIFPDIEASIALEEF